MKKIFLTGVILILLIILAADFYTERTRIDNRKNELAAHAARNAGDASTATPASPLPSEENLGNSNISHETVVAYTGNRTHVKHTKHNAKRSVTTDESVVMVNTNEPGGEEGYVVIIDGKEPEIAMETSRAYYGNKPAEKKVEKKQMHMPSNIGPEVGYNQNTMEHNGTSNIMCGHVNVGLLYNINLGANFAIQPGVKYITKGNRLQSSLDNETTEKLSLNYIQVPVDLIYKFGRPGNARFMIGAYPYAAYLVNSKDKFRTASFNDGSDVLPSTPTYNTNNINTFDWGFGGFVGVQSDEGLFAKAGAEFGMADIMKNTNDNRNSSVMISIGYIFGGRQ